MSRRAQIEAAAFELLFYAKQSALSKGKGDMRCFRRWANQALPPHLTIEDAARVSTKPSQGGDRGRGGTIGTAVPIALAIPKARICSATDTPTFQTGSEVTTGATGPLRNGILAGSEAENDNDLRFPR